MDKHALIAALDRLDGLLMEHHEDKLSRSAASHSFAPSVKSDADNNDENDEELQFIARKMNKMAQEAESTPGHSLPNLRRTDIIITALHRSLPSRQSRHSERIQTKPNRCMDRPCAYFSPDGIKNKTIEKAGLSLLNPASVFLAQLRLDQPVTSIAPAIEHIDLACLRIVKNEEAKQGTNKSNAHLNVCL